MGNLRETSEGIVRILAIDPGETTGYVLFRSDGFIETSGNLRPDDILQSPLVQYSKETDLNVVMERGPELGKLTQTLRTAFGLLDRLFPLADRVGPGEWKPITIFERVEMTTPAPTKHQLDAFKMGLYFYWRETSVLLLSGTSIGG